MLRASRLPAEWAKGLSAAKGIAEKKPRPRLIPGRGQKGKANRAILRERVAVGADLADDIGRHRDDIAELAGINRKHGDKCEGK